MFYKDYYGALYFKTNSAVIPIRYNGIFIDHYVHDEEYSELRKIGNDEISIDIINYALEEIKKEKEYKREVQLLSASLLKLKKDYYQKLKKEDDKRKNTAERLKKLEIESLNKNTEMQKHLSDTVLSAMTYLAQMINNK